METCPAPSRPASCGGLQEGGKPRPVLAATILPSTSRAPPGWAIAGTRQAASTIAQPPRATREFGLRLKAELWFCRLIMMRAIPFSPRILLRRAMNMPRSILSATANGPVGLGRLAGKRPTTSGYTGRGRNHLPRDDTDDAAGHSTNHDAHRRAPRITASGTRPSCKIAQRTYQVPITEYQWKARNASQLESLCASLRGLSPGAGSPASGDPHRKR